MIDTILSADRVYRYTLSRKWTDDADPPFVNFILLNPSTADETQDDPTIRRCIGFAKREGFGAMVVTNLFAFRATSPKTLTQIKDPVGQSNPDYILEVAGKASLVICAWGNGGRLNNRGLWVESMLRKAGIRPSCFGTTKGYRTKSTPRQPKHPLYLSGDSPLSNFEI